MIVLTSTTTEKVNMTYNGHTFLTKASTLNEGIWLWSNEGRDASGYSCPQDTKKKKKKKDDDDDHHHPPTLFKTKNLSCHYRWLQSLNNNMFEYCSCVIMSSYYKCKIQVSVHKGLVPLKKDLVKEEEKLMNNAEGYKVSNFFQSIHYIPAYIKYANK